MHGRVEHAEQAMRSLRPSISAASPDSRATLLLRRELPARAQTAVAAGQARERSGLSGEPGTGAAGLEFSASGLLAGVSVYPSAILRAQPRQAAGTLPPRARA